jgi:glycosyltransferase involved in cell wall biosynthesis
MTVSDARNRRVLFVLRYFHPFIGGMEKQALTVAAALARQGWRIEVVTSRLHRSWAPREEIQNISIIRLPTLRLKYVGAFIFLVNLILYLYKNRCSCSLIHTFQVGYTSAAAIMMAKICKKASVLKLACSGAGGDIKNHEQSCLGRLFLACCKYATAIVVLNEEMQRELAGIGCPPDKICAIVNGVDTDIYHPAENRSGLRQSMGLPDEKIFVYTGRILFSQKRTDWLVRAICRIQSAQRFRLYIIGEGRDSALLQKLCKQLGLHDRVHILNTVPSLAPFLQSADVFILPSAYEGISNSLLEAMASGLAVLATDIPGNRELIDDGVTGILIPCGNDEKLISALEALLVDDARAADLGRNARERVCRHYAVQTVARKYGDLYDLLIKGQAT